MAENSNVSQLTGGTPTAGEVRAGSISDKATVKAGVIYSPTRITSGVTSVNGQTGDVVIDSASIGAASESDFQDHIDNSNIHVTAEEKAVWNECLIGAVNAEGSLTFWHAKDVI